MSRKKLSFFLLPLIVLSSHAAGYAAVKTSGKPLNPQAGRELILEEVMKIEDRGGDYFFRDITNVKIAPDSSILARGWRQLYQFNADGLFLRNYFKKGQGPAECVSIGNFIPYREELLIQASNPSKVMFYDLSGRYKKESGMIKRNGFSYLIHYYNNRLYFHRSSLPTFKGLSAVVDTPQVILSTDPEGKDLTELISFPTKDYAVASKKGARGYIPLNELTAVPYLEKFLIINHTCHYLLKLFDLQKNEVVLEFNREYKRVTPPPGFKIKSGMSLDGKKEVMVPTPEYLNDIEQIFVRKDKIWVFTSTKDEKKGILVDIFDSKGRYVDNFYIKLDGKLMDIYYDDFFFLQKDEDDTPFIVKYRKVKETAKQQ